MNHELITRLLEAVAQGPVMLVEFRGQHVEKKHWNDKSTGKPTAGAFINTIAAEYDGGSKQVTLELWAPKDATGLEPLPLKKGDTALCLLDGYVADFKATRARLRSITPWNGAESAPADPPVDYKLKPEAGKAPAKS